MFSISSQQRIWVLVVASLLGQAAVAQKSGNAGGSNRNSSIPRTPAPPDASLQPLFISGKVVLEGGGSLAEPVAIERICNGVTRREGYTDFKGQFQLQIGQNIGFQDASENDPRANPAAPVKPLGQSAGRQSLDLQGCELRAILAGYQSSSLLLRPNMGDSFQTDVGTLILKRLGNAKGDSISVTTLSAPKNALHAYEKATKAFNEDKLPEAQKQLEKAVEIYPQFAAAWSKLGDVQHRLQNLPAAHEAYTKALAADPQYVNPVYGLAMLAIAEKKWEDAAKFSAQVTSLNAYAFPVAAFYNAAANYNLGKYEAAEESAKKFKSIDSEHTHPEVLLLLSNILALKKDFSGAAQEIRGYLALVPNPPNPPTAAELTAKAQEYEQLSVARKR